MGDVDEFEQDDNMNHPALEKIELGGKEQAYDILRRELKEDQP